MSRSSLLAKLERMVVDAAPLPPGTPDFPSFDDPVAKFREEAERVGTEVLDRLSLSEALSRVLAETGQHRLYWQGIATIEAHGIEVHWEPADANPLLFFSDHPASSVSLPIRLASEPYTRTAVADVGVSVGSAVYGVAETGTVVETVAEGWGRVLPILAPCHVTLLSKRRLLMNQGELFQTLDLRTGGSARLLMTGPSRTADIEKTLILGVHGPRKLYVVVIP